MRQVACSGSLPPRWVTKNFSACGVITARRARHASPGQKERSRAAAARLALPTPAPAPAPRLALQQRTRTRARSRRPRSLLYREATLHASFEPGAKSSRLEPRTVQPPPQPILGQPFQDAGKNSFGGLRRPSGTQRTVGTASARGAPGRPPPPH